MAGGAARSIPDIWYFLAKNSGRGAGLAPPSGALANKSRLVTALGL